MDTDQDCCVPIRQTVYDVIEDQIDRVEVISYPATMSTNTVKATVSSMSCTMK